MPGRKIMETREPPVAALVELGGRGYPFQAGLIYTLGYTREKEK
jgi:hypothetical protein